jgi:hypothetical protein
MLAILICLVPAVLSDVASYAAALELRSAIFALALFAFLLARLRLDSQTRSRTAIPCQAERFRVG